MASGKHWHLQSVRVRQVRCAFFNLTTYEVHQQPSYGSAKRGTAGIPVPVHAERSPSSSFPMLTEEQTSPWHPFHSPFWSDRSKGQRQFMNTTPGNVHTHTESLLPSAKCSCASTICSPNMHAAIAGSPGHHHYAASRRRGMQQPEGRSPRQSHRTLSGTSGTSACGQLDEMATTRLECSVSINVDAAQHLRSTSASTVAH